MDVLKISKIYFALGLLNGVLAAVATALILIPELRLAAGPGSILTHNVDVWPGAWGWVSYFVLLIAGVGGAFLWSLSYYLLRQLFNVEGANALLSILSMALYEIGVLGTVGLTGYVGIEGGRFVADGGSAMVVTALIGWVVIPTGLSVGAAVLGTLLGILNLIASVVRRRR
ncbi:MAG: hypothetical protein NYU90_07030 [Aigarchaeota archaeon]|nr:hypothetical protein [Candidatus Calditenuis fumarioli]